MRYYHSALKKEIDIKKETQYYEYNCNIAFKHDICDGFKHEHLGADVYYSEPAWLQGYEKFVKRANAKTNDYNSYLLSINKIIEEIDKPIWLIIGSHAMNKIIKPHIHLKCSLNGYNTNLVGYNDDNKYQTNKLDNYNFIQQLSERYNRVCDFCAGYGNTGKIFKDNSKKFILSDINGRCITYIKDNLMQ